MVRRRIKHACTLDEWRHPGHRAAKIAEAWALAIDAIRAEGMEFMSPAPVTLYRDRGGDVRYADIRNPGSERPLWIDPQGHVLLVADATGLTPERTTYAHWAEGPLAYMGDAPSAAPDPYQDRTLQYLRHQNRALREVIDASMESSFDAIPQDVVFNGIIDFRVRGYFRAAQPRVFDSKQTHGESTVKIDGQMIDVRDLNA